MNSLTMILAFSTIMWYVIDNLKENIWGGVSYSRYITIAVSALCSFALAFCYKLDLIYALNLAQEISVLGHSVTALAMMGGSALVSEIIEMFRAKI